MARIKEKLYPYGWSFSFGTIGREVYAPEGVSPVVPAKENTREGVFLVCIPLQHVMMLHFNYSPLCYIMITL